MIEEGKKNEQAGGRSPKYIKISEGLSDSDKPIQSLIYPDQQNDILTLIEEGKKKQSPGRPPEYIKLTESLSDSDNDNQSLIYPDQQNEQIPQSQGDNNSIASNMSKIFRL